jgi:uncharacterized DUF497 family protein
VSTTRVGDFEWHDAKAHTNLRKHGVAFTDAVTVFLDPRAIDAPDLEHLERFVVIGRATSSRVLFVVYAERLDRVRLISAREASPSQRRTYEEG